MSTKIGQFECRILRDAMNIAAQFSTEARMNIDATGIHIGAVNDTNTAEIWIDIPVDQFTPSYNTEEPPFDDTIGINCEQLYRMLNAYEDDMVISFALEHKRGVGEFVIISGDRGTLGAYQMSVDSIAKTHTIFKIRNAFPLYERCTINSEPFRDWILKVEDNVSFSYNASEEFPAKVIAGSELKPPTFVVHHLDVDLDAPDKFRTRISLELIQDSIAPKCIDDDIKVAFGNDAPIVMTTSVNGCAVTIAIAPRIDV